MPYESTHKVTESFLNLSKIFNDIGRVDPYYSVLSDPKYMTKNLTSESIEEFNATGKDYVDFLFDTLAKCGINIKLNEALDFGCGVGRVSIPLSGRFSSVTGCDISEGNLSVAIQEAKNKGVTNATFVKNEFNIINQFGEDRFDLIYSVLVLQHMIPPLIRVYIAQFSSMLKPGGIAFLQLPTSGKNYVFDQNMLQESINSQTVQIHALEIHEVLGIINSKNCRAVDMIDYNCVGPGWKSHIFVIQKI